MDATIRRYVEYITCVWILNGVFTTVASSEFETNLAWQTNVWRQENLQAACLAKNEESPPGLPPISRMDHLLVDHRHKLVYCYVPKVACTNWKRLLMVLSGRWNSTDLLSIPGDTAHAVGSVTRISDLNDAEAKYCLSNYTRFLIVRHPFERLLSAYRNKLESHQYASSKYFQERVGRYIIKHYRPNYTASALLRGDDVTFPEFVQYLLAEGQDVNVHNEHWQPISQMCHPCTLSYNIIGKYESLVEDSDMILQLVNASYLKFPMTRTANTSKRLMDYFRQLSLSTIKNLYRLYEQDFKLFGYSLENVIGFEIG